jgi:hypothetical protein
MRTSFRHQSEAQPPNGPLTAAASPDTPSRMPSHAVRSLGIAAQSTARSSSMSILVLASPLEWGRLLQPHGIGDDLLTLFVRGLNRDDLSRTFGHKPGFLVAAAPRSYFFCG